ncbi:MAG: NTP transferase domain-containing protein [Proteobacteria bacterium]|nr:NTP transferase domain-containing protein [Pseudomonadota bacterium]
MTYRIIPAIMSGGAGTRLWPLSTEAKPKQFHRLGGSGTMFAETISRVCGDVDDISFAAPIVLSNVAHAALVEGELAANGVAASAIVLEPLPRNTAAVGAIAAALAQEIEPGALVLLLPADHLVTKPQAFHAAIQQAAPIAQDRIVTFGITPNRAATGYGYIKRGAALADGVFAIDTFREKPSAVVAQSYLNEGGYSWNAGIFLFDPAIMLEELSASADIRDHALAALQAAERRGTEIRIDAAAFARVPSQPLDIAVMEKTKRAAVVPCDIGWADVGSWDEMWRLSEQDEKGNVSHGQSVVIDGANNLLRGEGVPIYAAGVQDLIVVATPDAVIVLPRQRAQDVNTLRKRAAQDR